VLRDVCGRDYGVISIRLRKQRNNSLASLAQYWRIKVNTGCREREVCSLQWEWEDEVLDLDTSVFIIPDALVKNGEKRLDVLNRTIQQNGMIWISWPKKSSGVSSSVT
jgi:hypothetical protein